MASDPTPIPRPKSVPTKADEIKRVAQRTALLVRALIGELDGAVPNDQLMGVVMQLVDRLLPALGSAGILASEDAPPEK